MASRKRIDFISFSKSFDFSTKVGQLRISVEGNFPEPYARSHSGRARVTDNFGNSGEPSVSDVLDRSALNLWLKSYMEMHGYPVNALLQESCRIDIKVFEGDASYNISANFNSMIGAASSSSFMIFVPNTDIIICRGLMGIDSRDIKEIKAFVRKYCSELNFTPCLKTFSQFG